MQTDQSLSFNPFALGKAKIVCNFGPSECNRIKNPKVLNIIYVKRKAAQYADG